MAAKRVLVTVEPLVTDLGLWCTDCHLGSGARVWFTVLYQGCLALRSNEVCVDCGGPNLVD